ncbi:hypothetical protein F511_27032 [Dorcoceras hygrometricum]|uniref:Uncharacterized protein n=1 Tax=Dorcoceras hygrometricum TaxID=472368 RepID=A0A2Z7DJ20_9LAMI|nr:hypothetical protein F511_27032 [Dorcoceras hygrometricum]
MQAMARAMARPRGPTVLGGGPADGDPSKDGRNGVVGGLYFEWLQGSTSDELLLSIPRDVVRATTFETHVLANSSWTSMIPLNDWAN